MTKETAFYCLTVWLYATMLMRTILFTQWEMSPIVKCAAGHMLHILFAYINVNVTFIGRVHQALYLQRQFCTHWWCISEGSAPFVQYSISYVSCGAVEAMQEARWAKRITMHISKLPFIDATVRKSKDMHVKRRNWLQLKKNKETKARHSGT